MAFIERFKMNKFIKLHSSIGNFIMLDYYYYRINNKYLLIFLIYIFFLDIIINNVSSNKFHVSIVQQLDQKWRKK